MGKEEDKGGEERLGGEKGEIRGEKRGDMEERWGRQGGEKVEAGGRQGEDQRRHGENV